MLDIIFIFYDFTLCNFYAALYFMMHPSEMTYDSLDWDHLWRNARQARAWTSSSSQEWDNRAASFATRTADYQFAEQVLAKLHVNQDMSVLDVGSGPGTLSLPLARQKARVCAVDFSEGMLSILRQRAQDEQLDSISTVQCAWEDDWQARGIQAHDMVIASRSLNVADLRAALMKIDQYSRHTAVILDRISPTPFDPDIFSAVGRPFESGPDYIYTVNMLYSMKIFPDIHTLVLPNEKKFSSLDDAVEAYSWMLKNLTLTEEQALREYLQKHCQTSDTGQTHYSKRSVSRWAMIIWTKSEGQNDVRTSTQPHRYLSNTL